MNTSNSKPFLLLCRGSPRQFVLGALGVLLVVLALRFEVTLKLSSHALGGAERDAALYLWLTEVWARNLSHLELGSASFLNLPGFFPYTLTLAWSDNFFLPSLFSGLLHSVGVSILAAYNSSLLLAMFLNGFCTFVLCLRLSGHTAASLLGGIAWMSSSFFSAHLGHPQLQFAFWFPLGTLALLRAMSSRVAWRWSLPGLCVLGAFLTTVYYAVFLSFLLFLIAGLICLLRPGALMPLLRAPALVFASLPLLGLVPLALPYLAVQEVFGSRFLHEPYFFSASALSYFSASPFNLLFGWTSDWSHSEGHLLVGWLSPFLLAFASNLAFKTRHLRWLLTFLLLSIGLCAAFSAPGLLPGYETWLDALCAVGTWISLFAIIWFVWRLGFLERLSGAAILTNRALLALFLAGALICVLISFGPRGYHESGGLPGLALYRALYEGFPGFSAARAIGRIGILVLFLSSVATSIGLALLLRHFAIKGAQATLLCVLLCGVAVIEQFHPQYPLEPLPPVPEIFTTLKQSARSGESALILPFSGALNSKNQVARWGEFARLQVNAVRHALSTEVPVINGYSGQRSRIIYDWPGILADFPAPQSLRVVSEVAGLRWIVVLNIDDLSTKVEQRLEKFPGKLRVAHKDSEGNLLLELMGTRGVDVPGAQLLVPSYPTGVLTLELSAVPLSHTKTLSISVHDRDTEATVAELTVPADGSWSMHSFRVGSSHLRSNPLRLELRVNDDTSPRDVLFSRRTLYESGSPET